MCLPVKQEKTGRYRYYTPCLHSSMDRIGGYGPPDARSTRAVNTYIYCAKMWYRTTISGFSVPRIDHLCYFRIFIAFLNGLEPLFAD